MVYWVQPGRVCMKISLFLYRLQVSSVWSSQAAPSFLLCSAKDLSRSWEQDGQRRYTLEVMVDNTYFVESKKDAEGGDYRGLVIMAGTPRKLEEVL